MIQDRKNLIDGLPMSYDTSFVLKNKKKCAFCLNNITNSQIENNEIVCSDHFEFMHKHCISENGYEIMFYKQNDFTSIASLKKKVIKISAEDSCFS